MDGPALSPRELLILHQIEAELGSDLELERELRTMRPARLARFRRSLVARPRSVVVVIACCLAVSFGLLGLAVALRAPTLLVAVVAAWGTALAALLALARFTRRSRGPQ